MAIKPKSNLEPFGPFQLADAKDIKGAPQNKATKAELDAVPAYIREAGQIGQVTADGTNTGSYTMSPALLWVKDAAKISTSQKGVANGVATLGADGIVPASQLPSVTTPPPAETPAQQGVTFPSGVPSVSTLATYAEIPDAQVTINGTSQTLAHFSELYGANMPATGKHRQVAAVINFSAPTAPYYALKYGGVENIATPAPPPTVLDHEKWLGGFVLTSAGAVSTPETNKLYTSVGQNTDGAMTQKAVTDIVKSFAYPIQFPVGLSETVEKDYALRVAETITKINASPEIATVQYKKNEGAWTTVTAGATLSITRTLADYLTYKVTYKAGKNSGQLSILGTE